MIWDNELILVHYSRLDKKYTILSDVPDFVADAIYFWLGRTIIPLEDEDTDDDKDIQEGVFN